MKRNAPLRRRKPLWQYLQRKRQKTSERAFSEPRKPLKKVSKSQRNRLSKYYPIRDEFLRAHPVCGICLVRNLPPAPATEIHHSRGRAGALLCDTRFFVPSCRGCREFPHDNPREARDMGILAEASEWNVSLKSAAPSATEPETPQPTAPARSAQT